TTGSGADRPRRIRFLSLFSGHHHLRVMVRFVVSLLLAVPIACSGGTSGVVPADQDAAANGVPDPGAVQLPGAKGDLAGAPGPGTEKPADGGVAQDGKFTGVMGDGTGLFGEYFDDENFLISKMTRVDPGIDARWRNETPDPMVMPYTFSI